MLRHVDPLAPHGRLHRGYTRFLGTRFAGWLSRMVVWKLDPVLLRLSRGRIGLGLGLPTALLETRGARTGAVRRNGVIYFHDGERVVIIASKLGAPGHPAWFHNAVAHPDVTLGGEPFLASVVDDADEQARLWSLADRVFPAFATYRDRASEVGRTIPILQLAPR
jgi:deazaflavin-dependent oxidoreductase (nitroreductase family)